MRRLIIEAPVSELAGFLGDWITDVIESFEILHLLKKDQMEFAAICKVTFKDARAKYKDALRGSGLAAQLLDKEKDGACVLFLKGRLKIPNKGQDLLAIGGYLSSFGLKEGILKLDFLGSVREVKNLLKFFSASKINYKVNVLRDAEFSPDSLLSRLTDKQRKVLVTAFNLGYYDIPRRVNSDELGQRLNIKNPTVVMHRRKAERKLLTIILNES